MVKLQVFFVVCIYYNKRIKSKTKALKISEDQAIRVGWSRGIKQRMRPWAGSVAPWEPGWPQGGAASGSAWPGRLLGTCRHEPLLGWQVPSLETDVEKEGTVTK